MKYVSKCINNKCLECKTNNGISEHNNKIEKIKKGKEMSRKELTTEIRTEI